MGDDNDDSPFGLTGLMMVVAEGRESNGGCGLGW